MPDLATTTFAVPISDSKSWKASLCLNLEIREGETRMTKLSHHGPLRVQKPFQESDGSCHVYLLHPPGGLVGGDRLDISILAGAGTDTVITAPAAAKFYGCSDSMPAQTQNVTIETSNDAHIEWLPQESIFFNGAKAELRTDIRLRQGATYLGWEINCLGRKASGEKFDRGFLNQTTFIRANDQLLHREHLQLSSGADLQSHSWGLRSCVVAGTLVAVVNRDLVRSRADNALAELAQHLCDPIWGVTSKRGAVLVRYLGESAEQCRSGFEWARQWIVSQGLVNVSGTRQRPRIWNT